jgi:sporadic carbohydrate cluster protein (TIGR04323 family)
MRNINLFSFLNIAVIYSVPQKIQHIVIQDYAKKIGGKIAYFSGEDIISQKNLSILKLKIIKNEFKNIGGLIFFNINHFFHEKNNLNFIKKILKKKLSVHFASENISFYNLKEFEENLTNLLILSSIEDNLEKKLVNYNLKTNE